MNSARTQFPRRFALAVDPERIQALKGSVARWARLWQVPRLVSDVALRTSSRFRRSLGSYRASRAQITLAAWLVDGPADLLEEVLCHEAAHAAVHLVHGGRVRPHGPEWRDFMARAGVLARVRIPASEIPDLGQARLTDARLWEHRCPVCQATRFAKTRVTRWRCSRCRGEGRSGELVIERVPGQVAVDG
jgi:predicted SprT family Zn-dependent metalloprotease